MRAFGDINLIKFKLQKIKSTCHMCSRKDHMDKEYHVTTQVGQITFIFKPGQALDTMISGVDSEDSPP